MRRRCRVRSPLVSRAPPRRFHARAAPCCSCPQCLKSVLSFPLPGCCGVFSARRRQAAVPSRPLFFSTLLYWRTPPRRFPVRPAPGCSCPPCCLEPGFPLLFAGCCWRCSTSTYCRRTPTNDTCGYVAPGLVRDPSPSLGVERPSCSPTPRFAHSPWAVLPWYSTSRAPLWPPAWRCAIWVAPVSYGASFPKEASPRAALLASCRAFLTNRRGGGRRFVRYVALSLNKGTTTKDGASRARGVALSLNRGAAKNGASSVLSRRHLTDGRDERRCVHVARSSALYVRWSFAASEGLPRRRVASTLDVGATNSGPPPCRSPLLCVSARYVQQDSHHRPEAGL